MSSVLTIEEAAEEARVSVRTIYDMCRKGKVKAHKVGSKWRIHPEDLWAATLYTPDGTNDPKWDENPAFRQRVAEAERRYAKLVAFRVLSGPYSAVPTPYPQRGPEARRVA